MPLNKKTLPDGQYWDCLSKQGGECEDFGWRSNVIVNQCRQLLAAFMKGETVSGIQYIELGTGDEAWDSEVAGPQDPATEALADSSPVVINVADAAMQVDFINNVDDFSAVPTNRLQVTLTLEGTALPISAGETYPLREFALYGEVGGSAYMVDYVRHTVMHIGAEDSLTRKIRLVF